MAREKLTEKRVQAAQPQSTEVLLWDSTTPGLALRIGPSGVKSYVVQKDSRVTRRSMRITIGRSPRWSLADARTEARELLRAIDQGRDPRAERKQAADRGMTLTEAITKHTERMVRRSAQPGSVKVLREELEKHLASWLTRPLGDLDPAVVRARHLELSIKHSDGRGGPYLANRVMRNLRAVHRSARRVSKSLPVDPPTVDVEWNPERPRTEPIAWVDLAAWRVTIDSYRSMVRRDYLLFMLFTGLRRTDAAAIRFGEVDFEAGTIFRPAPKGGEQRRFTVPLSKQALEVLLHRRDKAPKDCDLAFPMAQREARGFAPIIEYREKAHMDIPSPHRLRDTFASAAHECGVDLISLKALLNHSLPKGDVTFGYVSPSVESLRPHAQRVADFLEERMRPSADADRQNERT